MQSSSCCCCCCCCCCRSLFLVFESCQPCKSVPAVPLTLSPTAVCENAVCNEESATTNPVECAGGFEMFAWQCMACLMHVSSAKVLYVMRGGQLHKEENRISPPGSQAYLEDHLGCGGSGYSLIVFKKVSGLGFAVEWRLSDSVLREDCVECIVLWRRACKSLSREGSLLFLSHPRPPSTGAKPPKPIPFGLKPKLIPSRFFSL